MRTYNKLPAGSSQTATKEPAKQLLGRTSVAAHADPLRDHCGGTQIFCAIIWREDPYIYRSPGTPEGKDSMSTKEIIIRYLIVIPGLFVLCFGIGIITKAGLGTSPISSIPYSMSLIVPRLTMGNYTTLLNVCLVIAQIFILRGRPGSVLGRASGKALQIPELIVQLAISVIMGYGIDISLWLLTGFAPGPYYLRVLFVVVGCCIMSLGIFIQLQAGVAMAPGDSFARAIAGVTGKSFGQIRLISDCIMVSIAAILCVIFLHNLAGAREGTIICALLVGNVIKVYTKVFGVVREKVRGSREA